MDNKSNFNSLISDRAIRTVFAQDIYASYRPSPFMVTLKRWIDFDTNNHSGSHDEHQSAV